MDIGITFIEPDDSGRLTMEELVTSSYADLVDVNFRDGSSVDIVLNLDAKLLDGLANTELGQRDDVQHGRLERLGPASR